MPTKKPGPYADDLEYLRDELDWVEARGQRIGTDLSLARLGAGDASMRPRRGLRLDEDVAPEELRRRRATWLARERAARRRTDARLKATRRAGKELGLDRLCRLHGLDAFERDVLLLAVAPCISRRFEEDVFVVLEPDQMGGSLTVEAAFAFAQLDVPGRIARRRCFGPRGALVRDDLVAVRLGRYERPRDLLGAEIELTDRTFGVLLGDAALAAELAAFSSVEAPRAGFDQVVLPEADRRRILAVVEHHDRYLACREAWGLDEAIPYGRGALLLFHGPPGTGKSMTAHAVARHMGKRVLNVDIPTFLKHAEADRFVPALFREARMQDALLFFDECEGLFADRRAGNPLMTRLLTELERFEGVAILATNLPGRLDEALDRRVLVKVRFPEPDDEARRQIWTKLLPARAPLAPDVDVAALARRFELRGGYIKNAVLVAAATAVHEGGARPVITQAHLEAGARAQLDRTAAEGEAAVVLPRARLEDVVLGPALREKVTELVAAARNRRTVLDRWGIGRHLTHGKGTTALFSGPPGTGKTLCAEAVAGELNRPLIVGALPALLSKWVGETEKNLEGLFERARRLDAVLFLDEADSLLAERGAGHATRHDDAAVNVLLQLIERHEGVVLLATNMPERLDRALARRLTWRLEFTAPDAALRARIWRRLLPDTVPTAAPLDFGRLGERFTLTGGHIKNCVLKAAYRAAHAGRPLAQVDLERAAEEEARGLRTAATPIGFASAS